MRKVLIAAVLTSILSGCQTRPEDDPRICDECRQILKFQNDTESASSLPKFEELAKVRNMNFRGLTAFNEFGSRDRGSPPPTPLVFQCPECSKAYDRWLGFQASGKR